MMFAVGPCVRVGVEKEQDRLASLSCFWPLYDVFVKQHHAYHADTMRFSQKADAALAQKQRAWHFAGLFFIIALPLLS
jgi:hypothetical protein